MIDQTTPLTSGPAAPPDPDAILAALDPEQRQVATALDGPVCVLAGAGTGKTRAITHRVAYAIRGGMHNPRTVLALTFTRRAAGEMRSRLRDLGVPAVQARTFHSAALRQLSYFWPRAIGGSLPELMQQKVPAVAAACSSLGLTVDRAALRDLAAEIEWAKVSMILAEDYAAAATAAHREGVAGFDPTTVARVMARYEDLKTERGRLDFEDVLVVLQGILDDREDIAREVRGQYQHFVVDEYQDVSPLQHRLLMQWLGDRTSLCVVGDAAQTIYSFTGATSDYLTQFTARHRGATVVKLERNYRSTPQVISVANRVLDASPERGTRTRLTLRSQQAAGPEPRFVEFADDTAEADGIADRIAQLRDDEQVPLSAIAVLFRTNSQSEQFERALADRGIGYLVRGGERFFDRADVRGSLTALRAAAKAAADDDDPGKVVRDVLSSRGWSAVAPETTGAVRDRWDALNALVGVAGDIARRPGATYADVVAELGERAATQNAPVVEGVTLASIHAAKGLEWDAVFVAGASDGLLPISLAKDAAAVEEERRLFYVALTRARVHLQVSWALARSTGARASRRSSRFVSALVDAPSRDSGGRRGATQRRTGARRATIFTMCRTCGNALTTGAEKKLGRCATCPPGYDEDTFAALRQWRREQARERSVPAYVVFTDATLEALAERKPANLDELSRIPGIGAAKLDLYGADVLALLGAPEKD